MYKFFRKANYFSQLTNIIIKLSHFKVYLSMILEHLEYKSKPSFLVRKQLSVSSEFPFPHSEISALLLLVKSGSLILFPIYPQVMILSWWLYVPFTAKYACFQFPLPLFLCMLQLTWCFLLLKQGRIYKIIVNMLTHKNCFVFYFQVSIFYLSSVDVKIVCFCQSNSKLLVLLQLTWACSSMSDDKSYGA